MSVWLMHVGKETIYEQVSGVGLFAFPPNEPIRIDDEYLASTILEHKSAEGLVRVPVITDRRGMIFETEKAVVEAEKALRAGREALVKGFISACQERIQAGKPPLPPSPRIAKIIEEDGVDLVAEGINLSGAGFKIGSQTKDLIDKVNKLESNLGALMEQSKLLIEQNKLLKEQLELKPKAGR